MYKALIDIGDYKKGDVVPDELAIVWDKQYKYSPVEMGSGNKESEVEPVLTRDTRAKLSNKMVDDYLNRNKYVVKKNIEEDNFDINTLNSLLDMEQENKNRKSIISAIKSELKVGEKNVR